MEIILKNVYIIILDFFRTKKYLIPDIICNTIRYNAIYIILRNITSMHNDFSLSTFTVYTHFIIFYVFFIQKTESNIIFL